MGDDGKMNGRWGKAEHQRFVDGLKKYGKNWKKVEEHVRTRTGAQIRSHAQKFFNRLQKELNDGDEMAAGGPMAAQEPRNNSGSRELEIFGRK
jgi:SHAQKYF class myb-like DNA-binding protein